MNLSVDYQRLPELHEHDFRSFVPVIGPLISFIRRLLYNLTAKWGVWAVIQQQNRINQMLAEWLHHQNQMIKEQLIDIDRDLTLLARTVAEIEVRQRYLLQLLQSQQRGNLTKPEDEVCA
ncbi:MAG: hypothetical protein RML46_05265 [Anaerolineae bacterium]|nr:hypothetical protein [Anaerolineae bacterium]